MAKTIVIGGNGDRSSSAQSNGGAYEGTATWSTFQGTNGAALDTATTATVTNNGSGNLRITSAGNFSNSIVDVYVYCNFAATYTDGRYLITAVDGSGNYIDISLAYSADTTADVNVGGAIDEPARIETLDTTDSFLADADTIKIRAATYSTLDASGNIITLSFTATGADFESQLQNSIVIESVDVNGDRDLDNNVILEGATNSATYCFNSTGTEAFIFTYGLQFQNATSYNARAVDYVFHHNGTCHDSGSDGFFHDDYCEVHNYEIYNNTRGLIGDNDCKYMNNYIYDNNDQALNSDSRMQAIGNELVDNNGTGGTSAIIATSGIFINNKITQNVASSEGIRIIATVANFPNLFYGNVINMKSASGSIGIRIVGGISNGQPVFQNNSLINCGSYGIQCDENFYSREYLYSNHFYNNGSNVFGNITTGDNPATGDPKYTDAANGDYTVTDATSDLIDKGADAAYYYANSPKINIGYYNQEQTAGGSGGGRRPRGRYQGT